MFVVRGRSMIPDYKPGDYVVTFNWTDVRAGDVVIFKLNGKNHIKRVQKKLKDIVEVAGDNEKESSRVAPVRRADIIGRVVLLY
ncbi:MAG: S24/S26 family peptidase [Candidatus Curtissbacteria bacterium]|nr:S24/S26 family peptidase [Candidatus Curtissbacteria bacterium]